MGAVCQRKDAPTPRTLLGALGQGETHADLLLIEQITVLRITIINGVIRETQKAIKTNGRKFVNYIYILRRFSKFIKKTRDFVQ